MDSLSAYRALNNSLKNKCNSGKWEHLKELTEKLKTDNNVKPFWNYIKSKRKGKKRLSAFERKWKGNYGR